MKEALNSYPSRQTLLWSVQLWVKDPHEIFGKPEGILSLRPLYSTNIIMTSRTAIFRMNHPKERGRKSGLSSKSVPEITYKRLRCKEKLVGEKKKKTTKTKHFQTKSLKISFNLNILFDIILQTDYDRMLKSL